jgi:hypothetical protein
MGGGADLRRRAGERADRVLEIGGAVGGIALVAGVAVLVRRVAVGAGAFDEAVGEEAAGLGIEELGDLLMVDDPGAAVSACQNSPTRRRFEAESVEP